MANNRAVFKSGYRKLLESLERRWQETSGKESVEQLVKRGMEAYRYSSEISPSQLTEIEMQLQIDLDMYAKGLTRGDNLDIEQNIEQLVVENTLWSWLIAITDKSQLEWIELQEDFKHDGLYTSGEVVGLGQFVCKGCNEQISIYHPQEIGQCIHCNGKKFNRAPFNP